MKRYIALFVVAFLALSIVSTGVASAVKPTEKTLKTPTLLAPENSFQVKKGDYITWSWTAENHATAYTLVVQMWDPPTQQYVSYVKVPVVPTSVKDKTVSFTSPNPYSGAGVGMKWRWQVQAVNTEKTGPWAGATSAPSDVWRTMTFVA